ncbi:uncharacterized protein LOC134076154 [Sardina pilchardus]|uniref:uncharacterized protein LOC134076154 n=1 Tax=Sardina pilchardus TaxID=27697 RepID=UPI002E118C52
MENSDHSTHGAEAPCLPDTSSEVDRYDLMIDIMRLPMMQFQAICSGIRNNMSPEELAKMVSSWTEERVRRNILQTMAELEERTNVLSSSYHDRKLLKNDQEEIVEMTGEVPEVQLAPVTKEVFVTVLDSMKSPSSDEANAGSKEHFISYVHGMVNKIKDFPKLFKASHKRSQELNITPAVCESLSELLALPDPDGRSTTSLHDGADRLCSEDEISRASRGVSSILLTPVGSSSQHDVNEIQQPQSSDTSLASVRSVHDNARGIVDTIITDLEDLYENLEPKEVEMLQSQSALIQEEPCVEDDATQKIFHNKVYRILCSAQVKLRMFFTIHRSQDIIPDSKTVPPAKETCHDGIQPEDGCEWPDQSDAEGAGLGDGNIVGELTDEPQVQALTSVEQQATMDRPDYEKDGHVSPTASQRESKDKKRGVGKGLKIFFVENKIFGHKASSKTPDTTSTLEENTVQSTSISETVSYTTESELETMSSSSIASPETATVEVIQHNVTSLQTTPQSMDICEQNETTLISTGEDEGNAVVDAVTRNSPSPESFSVEDPAVTSPPADEMAEVISRDNQHTMGRKFKRLFSKSPKPLAGASTTLEATKDKVSSSEEMAIETCAPDSESYLCKADKQPSVGRLPETPPSDYVGEGDGTSVTDMRLDMNAEATLQSPTRASSETSLQHVPAKTIPEAKANRLSVGTKMKTLFTKSPKPIDVGPTMQSDEAVSEVVPTFDSEMTAETPDDNCAPDAEATLQSPMRASSETSLQHVPAKTIPEAKANRLSVGKKMKTLFTKSPKPIDVGPTMQSDEAVSEVVSTLDSEMTAETPDDNCAPDAEATLQSPEPIDVGPTMQPDEAIPEVAPSLDSELTTETPDDRSAPDTEAALPPMSASSETSFPHVPAKTIPETKANRYSIGKKMKTLFSKSPKPIDVGPTMQSVEAHTEVAPSLDSEMTTETPDDSSAPDAEATLQTAMSTSAEISFQHELLTVPSDKVQTMTESTECSYAALNTVIETSQSPEMGPSQETAQASPILETTTCVTATEDGMTDGKNHGVTKKLKHLFAKHPKKAHNIPAVPIVSQDVIESQASEVTVQQSVNMSSQKTPQHEDIFEIGTGPSPTMTGPNAKVNNLSIGKKLKQLFFRPNHPEARPVAPLEEASTVFTEHSSEPAFPEGFHTLSEATLALKTITERMILHLDDADTAKAKLDNLVSHGVLRPFTDDLVTRVYNYLGGGRAPGTVLFRYASDPAILRPRTVGERKRELVVERDPEIVYAFTERSINAVIRQVLELLLPLVKDVDVSGCRVLDRVTDIMAKEITDQISITHLSLQRTDTEDSDIYSESITDTERASRPTTATDDRTITSSRKSRRQK